MLSIAVSKICMTELIFVDPGMKVNGQYYGVCLTLSADATSDQASMLQAYVCLSIRQRSISSCQGHH